MERGIDVRRAAAMGGAGLVAIAVTAAVGAGTRAVAAAGFGATALLGMALVAVAATRRREREQARSENVELMRMLARHRRTEADLTRIQELMDAGSFLLDAGTETLVCSPAMERITGGLLVHGENSLDELVSRVHGEDREFFRAQIDRALAGGAADADGGAALNFHFRLVRPNGEIRLIHLRANPERDVHGNIRGLFAFCQDAREAAAAPPDDLDSALRAAFEESALPTALVGLRGSANGQLVRVNRAFARRLGYPLEDLHGRAFAELGGPEHVRHMEKNLAELRAAGAGASYTIRCARPDGELVPLTVHGSCASDGDGEPLYAVVHLVDASVERKHGRRRFAPQPAEAIAPRGL